MISKLSKGLKVVGGLKKIGEVIQVAKQIKEYGEDMRQARVEAEKGVLQEKLKDKIVFDLDIVNQKKDTIDGVVMWTVLISGILMFIPQTADYMYRGWVQFELASPVFQIAVYGLLVKAFGGKVVYDLFKALKEVMGNRVVNSIEPKNKK